MLRTAAIFLSVVGFAIPAIAQHIEPQFPENTIDCKQFKKTGPREWIEVGTAVFDLGEIKDINLTGQPVTPGFFKFDGVDLYPVVEQKCGAVPYFNRGNAEQAEGDYDNAVADYNEALRLDPKLVSATIQRVFALKRLGKRRASNTMAQTPITLEQGAAVPKTELEQGESASTSAQTPTQANINKDAPTSEHNIVKSQSENKSCGDRKSVYVADGLTDAEGDRALIEIVFKNNMNDREKVDQNSGFIIREYRNNQLAWTYKGKTARRNYLVYFMFTPANFKQENPFGRLSRQNPVILKLNYLKPNRNGTGEAILYLGGLRTLFASKENVRRFKIEGNRPANLLPEAFYFDRCE